MTKVPKKEPQETKMAKKEVKVPSKLLVHFLKKSKFLTRQPRSRRTESEETLLMVIYLLGN